MKSILYSAAVLNAVLTAFYLTMGDYVWALIAIGSAGLCLWNVAERE